MRLNDHGVLGGCAGRGGGGGMTNLGLEVGVSGTFLLASAVLE